MFLLAHPVLRNNEDTSNHLTLLNPLGHLSSARNTTRHPNDFAELQCGEPCRFLRCGRRCLHVTEQERGSFEGGLFQKRNFKNHFLFFFFSVCVGV
jgi:hypothetical protein